MPVAPPRPCRVPGCRALVKGGGYCPPHTDRAPNRAIDLRRGSSSARGYDVHWQRVRAQFLRLHPLCQMDCEAEGVVTVATEVDHVIALRDGGSNRHENLRAACKPCHSRRTLRDQVRSTRSRA